ncbi:PH domain-containing protein [Streptomyces vinaceus]|uniref:PH domain-containing protein n=1 Tax=Streptomyces vinaceus TaxID=1960 RepID=UPI000B203CB5|nr:PH domain-containing protein [Streptomyces vinaceus]
MADSATSKTHAHAPPLGTTSGGDLALRPPSHAPDRRSIGWSRIQTVDTVRGPIQQMFALSTLVVTTASAAGAVRIDGLAQDKARDLAEELTRITQATPGDAT